MGLRPRRLDFQPFGPGPDVEKNLTKIERNRIAVAAFGPKHKMTEKVWEKVLDATVLFAMTDVSKNQPIATEVLSKLHTFIAAARALYDTMFARKRPTKPPKNKMKSISSEKSSTPTTLGEATRGTYFENPSSPTPRNLPLFLANLLDGLIPLAALMEHEWKQKKGGGLREGSMWDDWITKVAAILRKHEVPVSASNDSRRRKDSEFVIFIRELQKYIPPELRKSEAEDGLPKAISRALAGTQQPAK